MSSSISTTTPSGESPTTLRQHPPPRRIRRLSPWFNSDSRCERRRTRLLERRYRKSRSDGDRTAWVKQMRSMHALYERKENLYWTTCIANEAGNLRKMRNSVSAVLRRCKDPSVKPSCLTADILSKFFKDKMLFEWKQTRLTSRLIPHILATNSLVSENIPWSSVKRSLTLDSRRALATAFVASRIDCCNGVLYGVAKEEVQRLQVVLNAAARLVVGTGMFSPRHPNPPRCPPLAPCTAPNQLQNRRTGSGLYSRHRPGIFR